MSVPNPEALCDRRSVREIADAQLRNPDLTPGEHRVAWLVYRCSSETPDSALDEGASFSEEPIE